MKNKISRAIDTYKQSIIGISPRESKLTRPLIWALEEMKAEGYSLAKMAKALGISKRSLQRWKSQGAEIDSGLQREVYEILEERKPVSFGVVGGETESKPESFEAPLLRAKANRENPDLLSLAQSIGVSLDALIQHGGETYIIDPEDKGGDFIDVEEKIEGWLWNAEVEENL